MPIATYVVSFSLDYDWNDGLDGLMEELGHAGHWHQLLLDNFSVGYLMELWWPCQKQSQGHSFCSLFLDPQIWGHRYGTFTGTGS